jgi:hypothetical protein
MRLKTIAGTICTLLLFLGVSSAFGQTITTGVIHGVVRDDALTTLGDVSASLTAIDGGVFAPIRPRAAVIPFRVACAGTYTLLLERLAIGP